SHPIFLYSFPTRRSSDLFSGSCSHPVVLLLVDDADEMLNLADHAANCRGILQLGNAADLVEIETDQRRTLRVMAADCTVCLLDRSEEHTSELQSPDHLVC